MQAVFVTLVKKGEFEPAAGPKIIGLMCLIEHSTKDNQK
jgi:hypothetical protein